MCCGGERRSARAALRDNDRSRSCVIRVSAVGDRAVTVIDAVRTSAEELRLCEAWLDLTLSVKSNIWRAGSPLDSLLSPAITGIGYLLYSVSRRQGYARHAT
jgi:hypothetical protein